MKNNKFIVEVRVVLVTIFFTIFTNTISAETLKFKTTIPVTCGVTGVTTVQKDILYKNEDFELSNAHVLTNISNQPTTVSFILSEVTNKELRAARGTIASSVVVLLKKGSAAPIITKRIGTTIENALATTSTAESIALDNVSIALKFPEIERNNLEPGTYEYDLVATIDCL